MPSPSWTAALSPIKAIKQTIRERKKSREPGSRKSVEDTVAPPKKLAMLGSTKPKDHPQATVSPPSSTVSVSPQPTRFTRRDQLPTRTQRFRQEQYRNQTYSNPQPVRMVHANQAWPSPDQLLKRMGSGEEPVRPTARMRTRSESAQMPLPPQNAACGWTNGAEMIPLPRGRNASRGPTGSIGPATVIYGSDRRSTGEKVAAWIRSRSKSANRLGGGRYSGVGGEYQQRRGAERPPRLGATTSGGSGESGYSKSSSNSRQGSEEERREEQTDEDSEQSWRRTKSDTDYGRKFSASRLASLIAPLKSRPTTAPPQPPASASAPPPSAPPLASPRPKRALVRSTPRVRTSPSVEEEGAEAEPSPSAYCASFPPCPQQPGVWRATVNDEEEKMPASACCTACRTKYSLMNREEGCTACAMSFCKKCVRWKAVVRKISQQELSVCKECYDRLMAEEEREKRKREQQLQQEGQEQGVRGVNDQQQLPKAFISHSALPSTSHSSSSSTTPTSSTSSSSSTARAPSSMYPSISSSSTAQGASHHHPATSFFANRPPTVPQLQQYDSRNPSQNQNQQGQAQPVAQQATVPFQAGASTAHYPNIGSENQNQAQNQPQGQNQQPAGVSPWWSPADLPPPSMRAELGKGQPMRRQFVPRGQQQPMQQTDEERDEMTAMEERAKRLREDAEKKGPPASVADIEARLAALRGCDVELIRNPRNYFLAAKQEPPPTQAESVAKIVEEAANRAKLDERYHPDRMLEERAKRLMERKEEKKEKDVKDNEGHEESVEKARHSMAPSVDSRMSELSEATKDELAEIDRLMVAANRQAAENEETIKQHEEDSRNAEKVDAAQLAREMGEAAKLSKQVSLDVDKVNSELANFWRRQNVKNTKLEKHESDSDEELDEAAVERIVKEAEAMPDIDDDEEPVAQRKFIGDQSATPQNDKKKSSNLFGRIFKK